MPVVLYTKQLCQIGILSLHFRIPSNFFNLKFTRVPNNMSIERKMIGMDECFGFGSQSKILRSFMCHVAQVIC